MTSLSPRTRCPAIIAADPVLQACSARQRLCAGFGGELLPLTPQLLKTRRTQHTLVAGRPLVLHLRGRPVAGQLPRSHPQHPLYLQMLRDTPVVYGDSVPSRRTCSPTYQLYANAWSPARCWARITLQMDLGFLALHRAHFRRGVLNNLFVTTLYLREYPLRQAKGQRLLPCANSQPAVSEFRIPLPALRVPTMPTPDLQRTAYTVECF